MNMTDTTLTKQITSPWLTKREAAEYAKVSERTIDNWRLLGLEWSCPSGSVRIHVADLDTFLTRNKASSLAR